MVQRERLIREFMELVQIDSETGFEQDISRVLQAKFSALGCEVTEDDAKEKTGHGAGNLFAWLPARAAAHLAYGYGRAGEGNQAQA